MILTALKKFFVPHAENNYHPHILHTKRAIFYTLVFGVMKSIIVLFVIFLPQQAYLHPDVLREQYAAITSLTNVTRSEHHVPELVSAPKLDTSAQNKANDMAAYHYFSHTSPEGHALAYFLDQTGYDYLVAGENLAVGFTNPQALVNAWINSPKHYANLIDSDFTEVGLGLESGVYRGEPVVYVAQHFGNRTKQSLAVANMPPVLETETHIAGIKVLQSETVHIDEEHSWMYWLEQNGGTVLQARVAITGAVVGARVVVGAESMILNRLGTSTIFVGQLTVPGNAEQFFSTLVLPTVTVTDATKKETVGVVNWFNIKSPVMSVTEQYVVAKKYSGSFTDIFLITKSVYAFFIIFFILALVVNIVIEIRRQHHHIIVQTMLLIALLVFLWQV